MEECEAEQAAAADDGAAGSGKGRKKISASHAPSQMGTAELLKWAAAFVAAVTGTGSGSGGSSKGASKYKLPLQVAPNLQLLSLGRVEHVHPRFHNDKFIFPVGFTIRRRAKTPCSGDRELWHTGEIVADPEGCGPVFR